LKEQPPKHTPRIRPISLVLAVIAFFVLPNRGVCGSAEDFVRSAREQIGRTVLYDSAYRTLEYPNGDLPIESGVCTDVVIRAMRSAYEMDLQKLVHEDMKGNFSKYPQLWGLQQPDKNIDHRRVPNLRTFFERKGWSLPVTHKVADYRPGDLVTCILPKNLPHIMIVSDRKNRSGIPYAIHNIGAGAREEDRLFEFELTGHYRIPDR
jgi:uncharacterized protein YijF (DUF1287 family)